MAYTKQTFVFNQILTAAQMNQVEANIEDSRLATGTRAVFNQTNAPNFWTKVTDSSVDQNIIRIVTGTVGNGGSVDFLDAFGASAVSEGTAISGGQTGSHSHVLETSTGSSPNNGQSFDLANTPNLFTNGNRNGSNSGTVRSLGSASSHTHGMPEVKYQDLILAQKD